MTETEAMLATFLSEAKVSSKMEAITQAMLDRGDIEVTSLCLENPNALAHVDVNLILNCMAITQWFLALKQGEQAREKAGFHKEFN